jgi:hypothetical protein
MVKETRPAASARLEDSSRSVLFARRISWIGHPLVFVPVSLAIVVTSQLPARVAVPILAALLISVILPIALLLVGGVRRGRWQDSDVSVREERKRFYPWALLFAAFGTFLNWMIGAPSYIIRGSLITLVLFIVAGVTNFWFKISLHTLFACYCALILCRINPLGGAVAFLLAGFVFWSRVILGRHTVVEALTGAALGLGGGIFAAWWS